MEPEIIKKFQQFFDQGRIKKKQKLILIFAFVIIATFFWFLNILGEEHVSTIKYPVRYSNFPADKVLVSELPSNLSLRVRARGFKILQHNFSSSLYPLRFDYQSFRGSLPNVNNIDDTFILTETTKNRLDEQLDEIEIISVLPDTLFFHFASEISKKVKVRANILYELEKQFMVNGEVVADPDSIVIKGPGIYIDTIEFINTQYYRVKKLNKQFSKNMSLEIPHENVSLSIKRVNIIIPVEKFTENQINVPIEAINLPEGFILRTFPGSVTAKFHVVLSEFDKTKAEHFRAVVDFNSIQNKLGNKLKVKIVKTPENISLVSFSPANVEYIIER